MPTLCVGDASGPCSRGPGNTPRKASPGSEPPRCAACVACHGIDGRGGNRWCEVLGCKSMASAAVMDVITEDPLTLVKNAVMGVPTYCETHAQLVRGDLAHTGSIHNAAVKIKAFWAQYQQLNCVRTYGRPRNLAARTAKFLKGCRVPWLTFMSHEDPTFREYVTHYISQPHLCVLGPRGGTAIIKFMLEAARSAGLPGHAQLVVMDDNIYCLLTLSGCRLRPLSGSLMRKLIIRRAQLLLPGDRCVWSVRPHANSKVATHFGRKVFPDTRWHSGRSAESVLQISECPSLLYTAVLGMRIDVAEALLPKFGAGQDDVERTVRFIMFGQKISIFRNIFTRKPHYEAGGLGSGFSTKEDRLREHRRHQQDILEWA